mmetsp:Transcript_27267/g.54964  ORF Transcript_27267/g.54964 Transcript_27267/m.54964 type:complete len:264 (+) Transcript_27267:97-888(+)
MNIAEIAHGTCQGELCLLVFWISFYYLFNCLLLHFQHILVGLLCLVKRAKLKVHTTNVTKHLGHLKDAVNSLLIGAMPSLLGQIDLSQFEGLVKYFKRILKFLLTEQSNSKLDERVRHLGMIRTVHFLPNTNSLLNGIDRIIQVVGTDVDDSDIVKCSADATVRFTKGRHQEPEDGFKLNQSLVEVAVLEKFARPAMTVSQSLLVDLVPSISSATTPPPYFLRSPFLPAACIIRHRRIIAVLDIVVTIFSFTFGFSAILQGRL